MPPARGIIVEVIGDDRSALRMWERQATAAATTTKAYKKVTLTAQETAAAEVSASLKASQATEARIAGLRAFAASQPVGSPQAVRSIALADAATVSLARSQGQAVTSTRHLSSATKEGERDLNKLSRGLLAGSGLASSLGRSLAFASTGFIAFAAGATLIKSSIDAARALAVAQRQVNQQLKVSGKSWDQYGEQVNKVTLRLSHLSGFTHVELLQSFGFIVRATGNVNESLKLMSIATDVARGRGISLQAATLALTKAVGGSATALRRLGIIVPATAKGMDAINFVAKKFAGQAQAGTSAVDRFHATLVDTEEIIGQALLPTVNKLVKEFGNWLARMNESGRLQRDVAGTIHEIADAFKAIIAPIRLVDRLTGSFANTIKALVVLRLGFLIFNTWIPALTELAAKWGLVGGAATAAGAAQQGALAAGSLTGARAASGAAGTAVTTAAAVGVEGGLFGLLQRRRLSRNLPSVFNQYASSAEKASGATANASSKLAIFSKGLGAFALLAAAPAIVSLSRNIAGRENALVSGVSGTAGRIFRGGLNFASGGALFTNPITDAGFGLFDGGRGTSAPFASPQALQKQLGLPTSLQQIFGKPPSPNAFLAGLKPLRQFWTKFELTFKEQLSQVQASLTRGTSDDVAAARQIVARVRRLLAAGQLHGKGLLDALGQESQALNTIWASEDAAAQKRAQRAQDAKAKIQAQIEAAIDPVRLEVQLARAQLSGSTPAVIGALKALRAAALKMLNSGKLSAQQQLEALNQVISLNQQIKDAATQSDVQFQVPAKLALQLAKDQALGRDTTKDLLAIKAALLKFIKHHRNNLAALTDAYNQLASINQQLGASASSAFGLFKKASVKALSAGLGLTPDQRRQLEQRLSQRGPGGTVPGQGIGAAGFVIGPDGRPLRPGRVPRTLQGGARDTVSPSRFNRLLRTLERTADRPIRVVVDLDGKVVAENTTRHQQGRRKRNASQRRGPNTATATA